MVDFDKIEYKFKLTSIDDYELRLKLNAKGGVFDTILGKASSELAKKGVSVDGDPSLVDSFDVPADSRYFNIIRTALNKPLKKIRKQIKSQKVEMLNEKVSTCRFSRVGDYWRINILVVGAYADKR